MMQKRILHREKVYVQRVIFLFVLVLKEGGHII